MRVRKQSPNIISPESESNIISPESESNIISPESESKRERKKF